MLLVYTRKSTPRLKYIFKQLFVGFLDMKIGFTSAVEEFIAHDGPKLSYGRKPLGNELFFQSHSLLFDQGINDVDINVTVWDEIPVFFQMGENSALPFDIFAASFFLLSRYEEYLPHIRDEHNRFDSTDSLAFKEDFIKLPLVDIWVAKLYGILDEKFDFEEKLNKEFRFESTINVNQAYTYRLKGLIRTFFGFVIDFSRFRISKVYDRLVSYWGLRKDPFDSFSYLERVQESFKVKMSYFFLVANYSRYDRNLSYHRSQFKTLIKNVGDWSKLGILPSYYSNSEPELYKIEKKRLENITNYRIGRSRQHMIKLQLPESYRYLIDNEIYNDYSMGYADNIGYRASVSEPFFFYDLDLEVQTPLKIYPFVINDYAMKNVLKLSPEEALEEVKSLLIQSKKLGGSFISLFHNESLGRADEWKGWRYVYLEMIKLARS